MSLIVVSAQKSSVVGGEAYKKAKLDSNQESESAQGTLWKWA